MEGLVDAVDIVRCDWEVRWALTTAWEEELAHWQVLVTLMSRRWEMDLKLEIYVFQGQRLD
jgi:hypothetical protein